jgi:GT2 family glycosyltransferase
VAVAAHHDENKVRHASNIAAGKFMAHEGESNATLPAEKPRITAVLVLYGMQAEESICFRSLRDLLQGRADTAGFTLLLYDNSPEASGTWPFPAELVYRHDAANGGVAAAYNAGLQLARGNQSQWLLLLDQDTEITSAYFVELSDAIRDVPAEVAAIVPRLTQDGQTHSPQRLPRLSHHPLPETAAGMLTIPVSAFNSAAAMRVSALKGFPERYWLDFLDHAVFHELQAAGGRVWLLQSRLEHRLSTQRLGDEASLARYMNVLQAERDFYGEYGSVSDKFYYRLRRAKQTAGHLLKVRDKRFALLSARAALGLLPATRARAKKPI